MKIPRPRLKKVKVEISKYVKVDIKPKDSGYRNLGEDFDRESRRIEYGIGVRS